MSKETKERLEALIALTAPRNLTQRIAAELENRDLLQRALDALEAAKLLIDSMETCHICQGSIIIEETPTHCENCSWDCDEHDEPACTLPDQLHGAAKRKVGAVLREAGRK